MDSTEAELENFRKQWREEVSAKTKGKKAGPERPQKDAQPSSSKQHIPKNIAPEILGHARHRSIEEVDEVVPHVYSDLGEAKHGRRLDETSAPAVSKEPRSALEHYEKAVERESAGSLGDSVNLYRKAFKLDANVHQAYKNKHFPATSLPLKATPSNINPSNAAVTVPNPAHHSSAAGGAAAAAALPPTLQSLLKEFSTLSIQGEPPPTDLSPAPPCPIASIPDEILADILLHTAIIDLPSFVRLAQVCKRLAYLVTTEDRVWKRIACGPELGFASMHYTFACQVDGKPLGDDGEGGLILSTTSEEFEVEPEDEPDQGLLTSLLVPSVYPSYRTLFRRRPRIRFNGCYISTVNYTRPGASSPSAVSWNSPIHIVTYYRYLRFLRDGTCISLLTTSEPADVVPYLHPENMHKNHGGLPSAVMKDALLGRWRLSGPAIPGVTFKPLSSASPDVEDVEVEKEGTLHVETAGATPKYLYKMVLALGSAGKGARNNKLSWQGYWSYNRLTDDWAEFGLKNDRPFYFSRVRSYGLGYLKPKEEWVSVPVTTPTLKKAGKGPAK